MKKWPAFTLISILFLLSGCAIPTSVPTALAATRTTAPLSPTVPPTQTPLPPTVPPTQTPLLPTTTPEEINLMVTPNPNLQTKDLSNFVDAWNSRNVQSIKSLYADGARIISEANARELEWQTPVELTVSDELITGYLESIPSTMTIRVIGEPIMVYDKLVAYTYRIEDDSEGYNAAGLLRFEGDKIYQHVFLVSSVLTSNAEQLTEHSLKALIAQMMSAWTNRDLTLASELYADDAIIMSDEDLAQVSWRDFTSPPSIDQLFNQFSGWKPELISPPVQLGDMAIFGWGWSIRNFPIGQGVRLVRMQDGLITVDIRYAIRPWEAAGNAFDSGG